MGVILGLSFLLAVATPALEILGDLHGDTGKPVSGVTISVLSLVSNQEVSKAVSKSDGSFDFSGLPGGTYGIEAKTGSTCAISSAINVSEGFTTFVHLRMVKGLCDGAIEM